MDNTRIEWTDRTLELVSGCTKVSTGCKNCYAERLANGRLRRFYPDGFSVVRTHPDRLEQPLHWQKPRRVFVCSRSDLFHKAVPDKFIGQAFEVMAQASRHTFQVLTKRPQRMLAFLKGEHAVVACKGERWYWGPDFFADNIWLGVSVENQEAADERIPLLLDTPAAVRFVSAEPLLEPLILKDIDWHLRELDWVIVGAESGLGARPMDEDWVRSIRDQCVRAKVPFFYKQRIENGHKVSLPQLDGVVWAQYPHECRQELPKAETE